MASQEAIKELGTNGGGLFNANSAHPFENPNGFTDFLEICLLLVIPFSLPWTFGKMAGDQQPGHRGADGDARPVARRIGRGDALRGQRQLRPRRGEVNQQTTSSHAGGNMEGKEMPLRRP